MTKIVKYPFNVCSEFKNHITYLIFIRIKWNEFYLKVLIINILKTTEKSLSGDLFLKYNFAKEFIFLIK